MVTRLSKNAPTSIQARVPPHNLEAEESVLGACLLSREAISNVLEILSADDFYKPAHAAIFNSILDLYGRGEPVDAITLAEELRRGGALESLGGKSYLATLVAAVPTPGSAAYYARIVEEHAILRRLIEASHSIQEIAYSVPEEVEEAVDAAENLIYQVSQRRISEDFRVLRDLLTENMELVEKLYERGSAITGLPTGFTELDNITAGLQPSNLIIVAARPSIGKSSFAINIAEHVAVSEQQPVVVFTLEMSKQELVQRLMCSEARVDSNRLRRGALQDSDWPKLSHALGRLAEAPMFIDDTPNMTIMEMRAKCRRLKSKQGLGLVIVDYLQLMQPIRRTDNRVQEVSEISRSLKILARELEVPVIAVSQLSRNVEYRADKRPILADLRDCVTGDTLVALTDGRRVPIRTLVGKTPEVLSVTEGERIVPAVSEKVWCAGQRPIFEVKLLGGRKLKATARHRLLGDGGWTRLDDLAGGSRVAIVRSIPEPNQPPGYGLASEGNVLTVGQTRTRRSVSSNATNELFWDQVISVEQCGDEEVFDLTVPGTSSWLADGIVSHNSGAIEMDSDLVIFIYRDEVYNPDSPQKGIAEVAIAKHRNGPIGKIELAFLEHYTKFANLARGA